MEALLGVFSSSFEPPSLAAEVARLRAWVPPGQDVNACPALAQVIVEYRGTADARRALLDICGVYAQLGDWATAEAPFRYVMEMYPKQAYGRVAHLQLVEFYRYWHPSGAVVAAKEARLAIAACAGTPEEGYARLLLAGALAGQHSYEEALAEFRRVVDEFPAEPYSSYARIWWAEALTESGAPDRAVEVLSPVLDDPVWGGRARYGLAVAHRKLGEVDAAVADYEQASRTADSVWFRSEAHRELARIFTERRQPARAMAHLKECLLVHPFRKDNLDIRLNIVQSLYASHDYLRAAQEALALELDALNSPGRYLPEAISIMTAACDDILDKCEAELRGAEAKPGASSPTSAGAGAGVP
jgi:tetratricopeptide (TPR) repeat protein